jgi:hypothetical protein
VFCNSLSDIFEAHPDLDPIRRDLWALIEQTPHLDWLLLTKRPEQIGRLLPLQWLEQPRENVWLGTSAETQRWADIRIPRLLSVPAVVHFVSAEPLLGPLDLEQHLGTREVNWVITGGESGAGFRPMDLEWVRSIRHQRARRRGVLPQTGRPPISRARCGARRQARARLAASGTSGGSSVAMPGRRTYNSEPSNWQTNAQVAFPVELHPELERLADALVRALLAWVAEHPAPESEASTRTSAAAARGGYLGPPNP